MRPWESVSRRGGVGPRSGSILKRPAPWRRASRRSPAVGAGAGAKVTQSSRPPGSFAPTRAGKAKESCGSRIRSVSGRLKFVRASRRRGTTALRLNARWESWPISAAVTTAIRMRSDGHGQWVTRLIRPGTALPYTHPAPVCSQPSSGPRRHGTPRPPIIWGPTNQIPAERA
jgi:hypothetical protein